MLVRSQKYSKLNLQSITPKTSWPLSCVIIYLALWRFNFTQIICCSFLLHFLLLIFLCFFSFVFSLTTVLVTHTKAAACSSLSFIQHMCVNTTNAYINFIKTTTAAICALRQTVCFLFYDSYVIFQFFFIFFILLSFI